MLTFAIYAVCTVLLKSVACTFDNNNTLQFLSVFHLRVTESFTNIHDLRLIAPRGEGNCYHHFKVGGIEIQKA